MDPLKILIHDISKLYISPDYNENILFKPLRNTEIPFCIYKIDEKELLTRSELINSNTKSSIDTYLKLSFIESTINQKNYKFACYENKSYDNNISIRIDIVDKFKNEETIVSSNIYPSQEIKIPEYIKFLGKSGDNDNCILDYNEPGGAFIINKGIEKFITLRMENTSVWPKYKKTVNKPTQLHFSFISRTSSFEMVNEKINPPQFFTIDINLEPDNIKCILNSNKTFFQVDMLLLIRYLTNLNFDEIESIISSKFESYTIDIFKILLNNSKNKLLEEKYKNIDNIHNKNYNEYKIVENYISYTINEDYIKKKLENKYPKLQDYYNVVFSNFLPHMLNESSFSKGLYLISIFRQFLMAITQSSVYFSKDDLVTKRITTVGALFENVVKSCVDTIFKNSIELYKSSQGNVNQLLSQSKIVPQITSTMNNIFNMQDVKNSDMVRTANLSNWQERIVIPNTVIRSKSLDLTKSFEARKMNASTICFFDIFDTPDHSSNTGFDKRLSQLTIISTHTLEVRRETFKLVKNFILEYVKGKYEDLINGVNISIISDYSEYYITHIKNDKIPDFLKELRYRKRNNKLGSNDIGIEKIPMYYKDKSSGILLPSSSRFFQIRINIGNGRLLQPMFIVNNGKIILENHIDKINADMSNNSFSLLLNKYSDIIEYVDCGQCVTSLICPSYEYFLCASTEEKMLYEFIKFPDYLSFGYLSACLMDVGKFDPVRGTFGVAQQKHRLSSASNNVLNRFDNRSYLAIPFERPCITNLSLEISRIADNSIGQHLLAGVCSFYPNNEDALVINRDSINKGMLSMITLNSVKADVSDIQINKNNPSPENSNNNYKKINDAGVNDIGTVLENGDAYYRCIKTMFKDKDETKHYSFDQSESYSLNYVSIVERCKMVGTENISLSILNSAYRIPKVGDKLTTRSGQKGTIGKIYDGIDMPYLENGERLDIIINSTSIIGRKTLNVYVEGILNNFFNHFPNKFIDFPVLSNISTDEIIINIINKFKTLYPNKSSDEIKKIALCSHTIYNPKTHEPMEIIEDNVSYTKTFVAPLTFSRLSQTADDKISARCRGKLDKLGQPPSGKKKGGGIKIGEMEVDVLATHGCVNILQEMMSDGLERMLTTKVCSNCGLFATYELNKNYNRWKCINCENIDLYPNIIDIENISLVVKIFIMTCNTRGIHIILNKHKNSIKYASNSII
jgi:DNA-directed RNA polymerase beta subunit